MRKFCLILLAVFLCIDNVNAATRAQNNTTSSVSRQATTRTRSENNHSVSSRNVRQTNARTSTSNKVITGRSATTNKQTTARVAKQSQQNRIIRAATNVKTRTFGSDYESCRDAYFTCMDQFCATQNESYRRCVCSSKLKDIQAKEKSLSQTSDSLKDFKELNIDVISKTSNEVKAMLSASEGESAIKKDNSKSANTLKNISDVLSTSKTSAPQNNTNNIKSIWSTTNLIGGADIANLTGESLFNAVNAQCSELVAQTCAASDLKMVASAYGMYIENDCSLLESNLDNKKNAANAAIRTTRHEMQDARLENYNVHNSVTINDCIANVRNDITANSACGNGYIHCLDFTGKYLNSTTGEPIYSTDFYKLENQITLSGDVLKNSQNSAFINMLNKKRSFAAKSLDMCRDDADDVWDEFLRQALVEIYQGQQQRVKTVKDECLQVVNQCYLKQTNSLKDFSNNSDKINLAQTLELSEEMCTDKLNTCSNLYGGGDSGLAALLASVTDNTIEQSCPDLLNKFVLQKCAVETNDSSHTYPYGCRKYAPGESRHARNEICNKNRTNPFDKTNIIVISTKEYNSYAYSNMCSIDSTKIYTRCNYGYYLYNQEHGDSNKYYYYIAAATECHQCPKTAICTGGTTAPVGIDDTIYTQCGQYYIGSLYQQMVIYALQNCRRSSDTSYVLSESLLAQIDTIMNKVHSQMLSELSKECSDKSGTWVDIPWADENGDGYHDSTGDTLLTIFYTDTGANTLWGYCKR